MNLIHAIYGELCVDCINDRYRNELRDLIGMFIATLPYCLRLNSSASFEELLHQIGDLPLTIPTHSHYTLQHIIENEHSSAFLSISSDAVRQWSVSHHDGYLIHSNKNFNRHVEDSCRYRFSLFLYIVIM